MATERWRGETGKWSLAQGQHAFLLLAGSLLLGWQMRGLDHRLEEELQVSDAHAARVPPPPLEQVVGFLACTDAGRRLPLWRLREEDGAHLPPDEEYIHDNGLELRVIQISLPDSRYNCHGWVFLDGAFLLRGFSVACLLEDNGYQAVSSPAPGDVAVFRNGAGEVTHTGLVRGICGEATVLLESKWGMGGRYVHTPEAHPWGEDSCTYYRASRRGHTLKVLREER